VVFTDLAGFTTLSEKLRERTVPILNEYMGLMVPIIRRHTGYVNKFLGDGMMFFYAAPLDNPNHATDAVQTALELQFAMIDFNRRLHEQDLPQVSVRIGISTGNMVVGDAGSEDASDYTVLGDSVNLAARLESANKYTGTAILINDTCKQHLPDTYLLRPVGKLQVVGKSESIMTWEPLCVAAEASNWQHQTVELSQTIVEQFETGNFESCLAAILAYEEALGSDKFSRFYQRQCEHHQAAPENFNGCIVLEAK
jgi:adenylate cyclase